jgi:undecaprenyl-diphosphatase
MNQTLFLFIHHFAGRNIFADDIGVFFAEYLPYLMVLGFLVLAFYENGWRKKLYLFAEGTLAVILSRGIVTELIRFFYHHERPFAFYGFTPLISESGWSFPSGHAMWFFALALTIWYFNRKWGWWYFVLAALMGVARIYAGVHWPYDILGGAILGMACAMFAHWLFKDSRKKLYGVGVSDIDASDDEVSASTPA